ncbi:MAG: hypothetical protein IRY91_08320 [Gemmatimonadaceae bacterium]|nr:hypothetical protein [Gemmatimonadaceae bacterium]
METLTQGVVLTPLIALVELSRVLGWIVALMRVPIGEEDNDQVGHRLRDVDLQNTVLERTMARMNEVLRLLPQDRSVH